MKPVNLLKVRDPYNYCDRWCERCLATSNCVVYRETQEHRQKLIAQGRDPDSWEASLELMADSLRKTEDLIFRGAQKWGIDPQSLLPKSQEEFDRYCREEDEKRDRVDGHPLYVWAKQWEESSFRLLGNFDLPEIKEDRHLETIQWYATLVPAKIYRALCEDEDDHWPIDGYDDRTVSLSIALRGLNTCRFALKSLVSEYAHLDDYLQPLLTQTQNLLREIEETLAGFMEVPSDQP